MYYNIFIRVNKALINKIGDWSNGMIGVSKTFGGSSILSSPASGKAGCHEFFSGFQLFLHKKYRARFDKDRIKSWLLTPAKTLCMVKSEQFYEGETNDISLDNATGIVHSWLLEHENVKVYVKKWIPEIGFIMRLVSYPNTGEKLFGFFLR